MNRAEFKPFPTSQARHMRLLKASRPKSATVQATYSVVLWPTKEVVVPVLPLPLPRISSLPSIPFNSLRPPSPASLRRAHLEDIHLALL